MPGGSRRAWSGLLGRLNNSVLARNTLWMALGYGFRLVVQVVYFVIIARSLGAHGYGAFVSVAALVAILTPFCGWGGSHLLVRDVSRDANAFGRSWGNALARSLVTGSAFTGVVLVVSGYLLPGSTPPLLILLVAVSDLLFLPILDASGFAFMAFQRLGWTARLQALLSLSRLVAALGLVSLVSSPTALQWGLFYLLSTILSAMVGVWYVNRRLGPPEFELAGLTSDLKEGFYFSLSISSQNVHNDIDKTLLARLATLEASGIYAAAYRLIQVTFTPIRSLGYASYARFFQHGTAGIAGSLRFARSLIVYAGAYGLAAGVGLYLTAPLLPYVLGADYQDAVEVVRWLALLPFLKALQYFAADTLTGAGFQGIRSGVQVSVAVFNASINLVLIPMYSWRGAAWASLASDFLLLLGLWASVLYINARRQDRVAQGLR